MKKELQEAREDYQRDSLLEVNAENNPIDLFELWLREYREASEAEFNVMTVSTVGPDNRPGARVMLLKGIDKGGFEFYTNYNSRKGREIEQNPHVALTFFWPELERQVRVEGKAGKLSPEESDQYFESRPYGSRIGAWASPQSEPISRKDLEDRKAEFEEKFGEQVPRPKHWGGYRVMPEMLEFWQGRSSRLHDRLVYVLKDGKWALQRLAP